jgi:hypothetical protein
MYRPALTIGKRPGRVDAQDVIDGGQDALWRVGFFFDLFGPRIRRSHDLPHAQPASLDQGEPRVPPVAATVRVPAPQDARLISDSRCAAELTPRNVGKRRPAVDCYDFFENFFGVSNSSIFNTSAASLSRRLPRIAVFFNIDAAVPYR